MSLASKFSSTRLDLSSTYSGHWSKQTRVRTGGDGYAENPIAVDGTQCGHTARCQMAYGLERML